MALVSQNDLDLSHRLRDPLILARYGRRRDQPVNTPIRLLTRRAFGCHSSKPLIAIAMPSFSDVGRPCRVGDVCRASPKVRYVRPTGIVPSIMRRLARSLAGLLLFAVASCGGGGTRHVIVPPPGLLAGSVDPLTAPQVSVSDLVDGLQLLRSPGTVFQNQSNHGSGRVSWTLQATADNRQYLRIAFSGDSCHTPTALDIEIAAGAVAVAPFETNPQPGTACPTNLLVYRFAIDLGAPLGSRKLLHPRPTVP